METIDAPPELIPSDLLSSSPSTPVSSPVDAATKDDTNVKASSSSSDYKYGIGQLQRFLVNADEEKKYTRWPAVEILREGVTVFRNCMVGGKHGGPAYVSFDAEPDVKYLLFSSFFAIPAILNIENDCIKLQTDTTTTTTTVGVATTTNNTDEKDTLDSNFITIDEPGPTKDSPPKCVRIDIRTILVDKYTAGLFEGLMRSIVRHTDGRNVSIVVVEQAGELPEPNPQWHKIFESVADKLHRLTLKTIEQVKVEIANARYAKKSTPQTNVTSSSSNTAGAEPQIEVTQTKRGSRKQVVTSLSVDQVTQMMENAVVSLEE